MDMHTSRAPRSSLCGVGLVLTLSILALCTTPGCASSTDSSRDGFQARLITTGDEGAVARGLYEEAVGHGALASDAMSRGAYGEAYASYLEVAERLERIAREHAGSSTAAWIKKNRSAHPTFDLEHLRGTLLPDLLRRARVEKSVLAWAGEVARHEPSDIRRWRVSLDLIDALLTQRRVEEARAEATYLRQDLARHEFVPAPVLERLDGFDASIASNDADAPKQSARAERDFSTRSKHVIAMATRDKMSGEERRAAALLAAHFISSLELGRARVEALVALSEGMVAQDATIPEPSWALLDHAMTQCMVRCASSGEAARSMADAMLLAASHGHAPLARDWFARVSHSWSQDAATASLAFDVALELGELALAKELSEQANTPALRESRERAWILSLARAGDARSLDELASLDALDGVLLWEPVRDAWPARDAASERALERTLATLDAAISKRAPSDERFRAECALAVSWAASGERARASARYASISEAIRRAEDGEERMRRLLLAGEVAASLEDVREVRAVLDSVLFGWHRHAGFYQLEAGLTALLARMTRAGFEDEVLGFLARFEDASTSSDYHRARFLRAVLDRGAMANLADADARSRFAKDLIDFSREHLFTREARLTVLSGLVSSCRQEECAMLARSHAVEMDRDGDGVFAVSTLGAAFVEQGAFSSALALVAEIREPAHHLLAWQRLLASYEHTPSDHRVFFDAAKRRAEDLDAARGALLDVYLIEAMARGGHCAEAVEVSRRRDEKPRSLQQELSRAALACIERGALSEGLELAMTISEPHLMASALIALGVEVDLDHRKRREVAAGALKRAAGGALASLD